MENSQENIGIHVNERFQSYNYNEIMIKYLLKFTWVVAGKQIVLEYHNISEILKQNI